MSDIALLVDNDVVIKLAKLDVYQEALSATGVAQDATGTLANMLRYMRNKCELLTRDRVEADRLIKVLATLTAVEPTESEAAYAAHLMKTVLEAGLDMQEGEIGLLAIATKRGSLDVATGDRRAICCLPALRKIEENLAGVLGRIICFEQIIILLCSKAGFSRVKTAAFGARDADETITQAVAYFDLNGGQVPFIHGLRSVIEDRITKQAPNWLKSI